MKLRTLLLASAIALMAATGGAYAVDDVVIDEITDELVAEGYTRMRIRHGAGWVEVEAWGREGRVERRYDGAGDMLRERLHASGAVPVDDDGETPLGDQRQTRTQSRAGDGTCNEDCDHDPLQTRTQTRAGGGDGTGKADGEGDGEPVRSRTQNRDGSGAGAGDGTGDGGERKQTRSGNSR